MKYEILCLIYVLLNVVIGIIYKDINVDIFFINMFSSCLIFFSFLIKIYINYIQDATYYKKEKNIGNNNPFNNLLSKEALIIGLSGSLQFLINLFVLKKIPFSLFIPISNLWIFFSLFFEYLILNIDSNFYTILSFIIFVFGILIFSNTFMTSIKYKKEHNFYLILLLLSCIIRGFHITYVKKQSEYFKDDELLLMDFFISFIVSIFVYIGYVFLNKNTKLPTLNNLVILILVTLILDNLKNYLKFISISNLSEEIYILLYNTSIIFSIIFGYLIFNEKITKNKIIGIVIMLISIYIYIRNN